MGGHPRWVEQPDRGRRNLQRQIQRVDARGRNNLLHDLLSPCVRPRDRIRYRAVELHRRKRDSGTRPGRASLVLRHGATFQPFIRT